MLQIRGHGVTYFDESFAYFPAEDAGIFTFVFLYPVLDFRSRNTRLTPADDSGTNAARFLIAIQDLGDASVRHSEPATDDAGTDPLSRQLDDLQANVVGKWPAVDEDSTQLIESSLT